MKNPSVNGFDEDGIQCRSSDRYGWQERSYRDSSLGYGAVVTVIVTCLICGTYTMAWFPDRISQSGKKNKQEEPYGKTV